MVVDDVKITTAFVLVEVAFQFSVIVIAALPAISCLPPPTEALLVITSVLDSVFRTKLRLLMLNLPLLQVVQLKDHMISLVTEIELVISSYYYLEASQSPPEHFKRSRLRSIYIICAFSVDKSSQSIVADGHVLIELDAQPRHRP